jgi:hypothetical protein
MKVTCRPEHRAVFEAVGFDDEEPSELTGAVTLVDESANYANDSELREIARRGIPFIAKHANGDEYGAGFYVSDGRRLVEVECLHGGDLPAVEIGDDGEPDGDQMHGVHGFHEVLAAAKKAIAEGLPPGRQWKSADEILKGMDPTLFREQRRRLLALIEDARRSITGPISAADVDLLDGLDNLLSDLADFGHDVLGMDCLLEEPEQQAEGGGDRPASTADRCDRKVTEET